MRINDPPPPAFPALDTTGVRQVDQVRPVAPVVGEAGRAVVERREEEAPRQYRAAPGQPGFVETRGLVRRQRDRRRRDLPVMIDTRSGEDRRQKARRASDATPPRIDTKA